VAAQDILNEDIRRTVKGSPTTAIAYALYEETTFQDFFTEATKEEMEPFTSSRDSADDTEKLKVLKDRLALLNTLRDKRPSLLRQRSQMDGSFRIYHGVVGAGQDGPVDGGTALYLVGFKSGPKWMDLFGIIFIFFRLYYYKIGQIA